METTYNELEEKILDEFKKELIKRVEWLKEYEPEVMNIDHKYITTRYIINDYKLFIQGEIKLKNISIYSFVIQDAHYIPKVTVDIAKIVSDQDRVFKVINKMKEIKEMLLKD
jgi:hypothetical protein